MPVCHPSISSIKTLMNACVMNSHCIMLYESDVPQIYGPDILTVCYRTHTERHCWITESETEGTCGPEPPRLQILNSLRQSRLKTFSQAFSLQCFDICWRCWWQLCKAFNSRILYGRYAANVYTYIYVYIISIPSPPHSFIPGLKPSFFANPSHHSLPFLLQDLLHGFPRLFTYTSDHIRFFTF